ncbi:DNA repair protein RadC [Oscillospiraceae bacterium MB08-C2-2]|nr:DNA repair protein RadC [Oscillospiraceae bacterium MB08-C2-2]
MSKIHQGHRERLKEKFRTNGLGGFAPHEMLEFLLFYSVPRRDTNEIGHELINTFSSISGVFDAPYNMLTDIPGIGDESATLIKLIPELCRVYLDDMYAVSNKNVINDHVAAKDYVKSKFLGRTNEEVLLICLGYNKKVLLCTKIAEGSMERVAITPSEVVKTALKVNSVTAMLAHNHPGGFCLPSQADMFTTRQILKALKFVNIQLIDHIIVGSDGVYSMEEKGMFPPHNVV